ncbi:hypothetical protein DFH08DRAFT_982692 [Mycena albidolilacea]|uniref:Uncharacterized protein n=1 Tax=Mycena albidolilacea TaxID=1033008 RepID=A0AAD7AV03_9AGAR|nr:hypothetical protein DFH08DRAFT_982692 [Mycena albidolilacea]
MPWSSISENFAATERHIAHEGTVYDSITCTTVNQKEVFGVSPDWSPWALRGLDFSLNLFTALVLRLAYLGVRGLTESFDFLLGADEQSVINRTPSMTAVGDKDIRDCNTTLPLSADDIADQIDRIVRKSNRMFRHLLMELSHIQGEYELEVQHISFGGQLNDDHESAHWEASQTREPTARETTVNFGDGAGHTEDAVTQATDHQVNVRKIKFYGGQGASGGRGVLGWGGSGGRGEGASLNAAIVNVETLNQNQPKLLWAAVPGQLGAGLVAGLVPRYLPGNSDLQPQSSAICVHELLHIFTSIPLLLLILKLLLRSRLGFAF